MKITKEAKIGISSVVILFILYWGINFLKGSNILSGTNTFKTSFENISGLEVSSPVIINGMKVGTVTDIDMKNVHGDVNVRFTVKKEYQIPSNSIVELTGQSLLGGKQLVLIAGDAKTFLENKAVIKSEIDTGLEDATKEVTTRATSLMDSLTLSLSKFNKLMSKELITNTHSVVSNVNDATGELSKLIKDEREQIGKLLENLTNITVEINKIMPAANKSMGNVANLTDSLSTSLPNILADLEEVMSKLNNNDNSVNKLLTDKELYSNATETLNAAAALLNDLKENPKRYINISVFGGKKDKK